MCLGCAFIALLAMFPRVGLLVVWIFTDWVQTAFNGSWVWPLLGLIFVPFTTLFYVMVDVSSRGSITLGGWLLIALGVLFDVTHWAQAAANRESAQSLYNQYGPGGAGA
jgi:hypothetical protein